MPFCGGGQEIVKSKKGFPLIWIRAYASSSSVVNNFFSAKEQNCGNEAQLAVSNHTWPIVMPYDFDNCLAENRSYQGYGRSYCARLCVEEGVEYSQKQTRPIFVGVLTNL